MPEGAFGFEIEVGLPDAEGAQAGTTVPYRILVVDNFAGAADGTVAGRLESGVADVTPDGFDDLMAAARPSLTLHLTDPTRPGNVMAEVPLQFDSIRAFEPANLAQQIPDTRPLMTVREQLVGRMRGKLTADQLAKAVATATAADPKLAWLNESLKWAPAPPSPASMNAVDGILASIDTGEGDSDAAPPPPPKTPIGSLISAAAGGTTSIPAEEASAVRRTLAEIDKRVSTWLTAVLHAPAVQAAEAAWRSLMFLVRNTESRKGIHLSVLHAPRESLCGRIRSLLIDHVFDEGAPAPDLIVVNTLFGNTAPELETLDELAQHAASLPAVLLAGASPGFLGVKHAWQVPTLPPLLNMLDQWQYAKWKTLRGQFHARFLGIVFGRCLLRAPHGRDDARDLDFVYREPAVGEADLVWAGGATAVAVAVSRSVAGTGWPTSIAGFANGRIEGFATAIGGRDGKQPLGPADTVLSQDKVGEFASVGLNVVSGMRDQADVMVWNGLTPAWPKQIAPAALLEVSLPYQLFGTRLSTLLLALRPRLTGLAPDKIIANVTQHMAHWLQIESPTPKQVCAQTLPTEDGTGTQLAVTVTPPPHLLPGGIPVVLGYRL